MIQMAEKKAPKKTPLVKVHDLPPKRDAKGGRNIKSQRPALQIPPPGFFGSSDNDETK
jgi:hypothetical protein